jgi:hypothetical protein
MAKTYQYSLTIATSPGQTQDESVRSLRAFLKLAIRSYGIRCTSAVPLPPSDTTTPENAPQQANKESDDE